jgi:hypothetical protein
MRYFIWIIFSIFILLLPHSLLGAPLFLKIELDFYPDLNLLKGNLYTKIRFSEDYKFTTSGFTIEKIKTSADIFLLKEKEFLKVSNGKKEGFLHISFYKNVNPWLLPIITVYPPFPLPDKPFTYEITLKIPKHTKMEILIPSEKIEVKQEGKFLFYTFRMRKPVLTPCILFSTSNIKKEKIFYKNFYLHIYYLPQMDNFSNKDIKEVLQKLQSLVHYLDNIGEDLYPFKNLYVIVYNDISESKSFSNILFINPIDLKNPQKFLHLIAKKKLEEGLFLENEEIREALITYLIDYQLAENKKTFRKLKVAFPEEKNRLFFYLLFLSQSIGEKNFINLFKKFYESNLFIPQTWNNFLSFIEKFHPEFKSFLISPSDFQRLNLKCKVVSLKKAKNFYSINLFIDMDTPSNSSYPSIPILLKVEKENGTESIRLTLKKKNQHFKISLKGKPKTLFLDPEYMLWRNLDFNEIPNCIAKIFYQPGVIVVKKEKFLFYKDIIDYFRNLGYKLSFSWIEPSDSSQNFQNLIYLDTPPIPWLFNISSAGFYFKVLPNPFYTEYNIGYLYISSKKDTVSALPYLNSLNPYFEISLQSGKFLLKKEDITAEGLPVYLSSQTEPPPRKIIFNFINSQVILMGIDENNLLFHKNFYQNFIQTLYSYNSNIILALDLPSSFQTVLKDYLENRISESKFKELIEKSDLSNLLTIWEIIKWAKINKVKVFAIGINPELFSKVINNGLRGLSSEELSKLPEIDLFNPQYRNYLKKVFK